MIFEKKVVDMFKGMMYTRCDDTGNAFYFSAEDFDGLRKEPYSFKSSMGHDLQGYIYNYDNYDEKRLVVFDHGFGGGHKSYMKEIEKLCKHGFRVFAYDHTGCMESGGETPNGMAQSLHDLDDCLKTIKEDEKFAGLDLSVMGHSWGGFSTMNICALHPEISHIVVMSGFVSVKLLIASYFGGILKFYRKAIMKLEQQSNPDYVAYNGVESLSKTDAKVLLVYSDDDKMCHKNPHYDTLAAGLAGKENIRMLLVTGKGHNPNYTEDAVKYKDEFFDVMNKKVKNKELETAEQKAAFRASYDWERMTCQDEEVWEKIFETLDA